MTEGTIVSSIVQTTRQGTQLCPWVINADQGKRINITLIDFGTHSTEETGSTCDIYATITEHPSTSPTMVCSGVERERVVYLSSSSTIEIQFINAVDIELSSHFFLKFTGKKISLNAKDV